MLVEVRTIYRLLHYGKNSVFRGFVLEKSSGLIPVKKVYEYGGTQICTSLTYKVIVWKQIDGKTGMEFYIFPNNFHKLDYYE